MNIIVCLDDNDGMLFNKRRLSSDSVLTDRIARFATNNHLWMNDYSAKLFEGSNIIVDELFLQKAEKGDYCFIENVDITNFAEKTESLIIYRWNRRYPSDKKFPISLFLPDRKLISTMEFEGNSHPEITEEIYAL